MSKRWTEQELEILKDNYPKFGRDTTARLLNKTPIAIYKSAWKAKLKYIKKEKKIEMSQDTEQILIGSLLGDGGLSMGFKNKCNKASFREQHGPKQENYLLWKFNYLKEFNPVVSKVNGKYPGIYLRTKSHSILNDWYYKFYPDGKKVIPKEIVNNMNPLALAVWCIDDGSYEYRTKEFTLATCCFKFEDVNYLKVLLENKFKLKANVMKNRDYYILRFYPVETRKLINIISPIVINMPKEVHYKLGNNLEKSSEASQKNKNWRKNDYNKNRKKYLGEKKIYAASERGKMIKKAYRIKNREKARIQKKARYYKNRVKILEDKRKQRSTPEGKLKNKLSCNKYYYKNRIKILEKKRLEYAKKS